MKRLLKILVEKEENEEKVYYSPFQGYEYGKVEEFKGEMLSTNMDTGGAQCSSGFYATGVEGLIYTNLASKLGGKCVVFEAEMSGDERRFSAYKWRFSQQKITRLIPEDELRTKVKAYSAELDWDYYGALFPCNPLDKDVIVTDEHVELLRAWDNLRTSVRASVGASVWASVGDSVWDSVGAYTSNCFPNISRWKYLDHPHKINPFQPGIDLWKAGLVPVFDGVTWRLLCMLEAKIVFEISAKDLRRII